MKSKDELMHEIVGKVDALDELYHELQGNFPELPEITHWQLHEAGMILVMPAQYRSLCRSQNQVGSCRLFRWR